MKKLSEPHRRQRGQEREQGGYTVHRFYSLIGDGNRINICAGQDVLRPRRLARNSIWLGGSITNFGAGCLPRDLSYAGRQACTVADIVRRGVGAGYGDGGCSVRPCSCVGSGRRGGGGDLAGGRNRHGDAE
jgi:hypothetical protein